MRKQKKKRWNN